MSATPILLDCDPGHDDAIALLLALASPELELRGITTVAGNQTIDRTTRNALIVLALAGRDDVPVARGAAQPLARELRTAPNVHGETGLDGPRDLPEPSDTVLLGEDAAEFLAARLERGVVLVPTGPLTNVATALERGATPQRIVWMGGSVGEGNVTPSAEFNAFVDPEAAARVFAAGVDLTMVGLDVTHRALAREEHRERLRASGPIGRFVAELLDFYGRFHKERYGWNGSPIHDALAVAVVIDPTLVRTEQVHVRVHTDEDDRGRTQIVEGEAPNAHVALDVEADRFLELLCSRIGALDG
jgi:pyrimidine-specific ribonucleoside hydrolase